MQVACQRLWQRQKIRDAELRISLPERITSLCCARYPAFASGDEIVPCFFHLPGAAVLVQREKACGLHEVLAALDRKCTASLAVYKQLVKRVARWMRHIYHY